jgi:hypothetical protein
LLAKTKHCAINMVIDVNSMHYNILSHATWVACKKMTQPTKDGGEVIVSQDKALCN